MSVINLDHILVPLDGSIYAEAVLPAARFFAQHAKATLTFLHIVEKRPPQAIHGQYHIATKSEAEHYLAELDKTCQIPATQIKHQIVDAKSNLVAREIARQQTEINAGLTILCTHGHSGLTHLISGSIAQQTCSLSQRPILLIHPEHPEFNPNRLLVPIDGTAEHEHTIAAAVDLAQYLQVALELLLVIPTSVTVPSRLSSSQRMLPFLTSRMLDMEEEAAQEYLQVKKQEICSQLENQITGTCLDCDFTIRRGDIAQSIIKSAQTTPDCLLVLGTHGRTGFQGFWEGSVANKIGNSLRTPMLLFPVN